MVIPRHRSSAGNHDVGKNLLFIGFITQHLKGNSIDDDVASTVIGTVQRNKNQDWFDEECTLATMEKNKKYRKMIQMHTRGNAEEYRNARREEKKIHRKKKREFEENNFKDVEHLKSVNECRAFYRKINRSRSDFKPSSSMCRNSNGEILTERHSVLQRWVEHFDGQLNHEADSGGNVQDHNCTNSELIVLSPTVEEVKIAIKNLKNNKSPGNDLISAELLKCAGTGFLTNMQTLIKDIWETEKLPSEWNTSIVCPIYKKGDPMVCANYRGISLLCTAYKILSHILFQRLLPFVNSEIGNYQSGFRAGKSTKDQIFCLRQILEKTIEFGIDTHHLFIDFRTAFDSINRKQLVEAMQEFKVPDKLIHIVMATMYETKCRIKFMGSLSEELIVRNGVRQGDSLSCLLFNIALEKVIRDSNVNTRGNIFSKSVQLLAYADDVDIIARTIPSLKEAFTALEKAASRMGLVVNEDKTKYMCIQRDTGVRKTCLEVGTHRFQSVNSFVYLGSLFDTDNKTMTEIQNRITLANRAFYGLKGYLKSRFLCRKTKFLIYKSLIRPVLTYASETWPLTKREENRLALFERKVLRSVLGGVLVNGQWLRRSNLEVYRVFKEPDIIKFIKINRMNWASHIMRMEDSNPVKKILNASVTGRRKRGRTRLRWIESVETDFEIVGEGNWRAKAKDRQSWRLLHRKALAHIGLSSQL